MVKNVERFVVPKVDGIPPPKHHPLEILVVVPVVPVVPCPRVSVPPVSRWVVLGPGVLGASCSRQSFTVGRLSARAQLSLNILLLAARKPRPWRVPRMLFYALVLALSISLVS